MSPVLEHLHATLSQLGLGEMDTLLDAHLERAATAEPTYADFLWELVEAEAQARSTRQLQARLRLANRPWTKTLSQFDFGFQPSLDRQQILALAQLEFVKRRQALHFLGPPGTGKSHLAIALGVEAVKAGSSVYFATLADLITALSRAEREGSLRERVRYLCRHSLIIVDEIGYLPVGSNGGNLFFQLVNACYERCAMILTSNRGFAEWGEIFGDQVVATALLDRLLHHAIVVPIEGSSYRLREHAQLLPEHMRMRPTPATAAEPLKQTRRRRVRKETD